MAVITPKELYPRCGLAARRYAFRFTGNLSATSETLPYRAVSSAGPVMEAGSPASEVATSLGVAQMQVSRMEKRRAPRISTLRRAVAAMGGDLVVARFPNRRSVELTRFNEVE